MSGLVVDASIVAKLLFEEEHSDAAVRLVRGEPDLLAPEIIWAEVANVAWKRHQRGELSAQQAVTAATEAMRLAIQTVPTIQLVGPALEIAIATSRPVYDALYLALALGRDCPLVTADRRLVNALANGPMGDRVVWIGDR